ncbi:pyridoxal 5'-phosphate synthase [Cellulomonas sp. zg-ZUI222]|uniref:Pyridoxal 5'-phosphate synthase n=1 Tax=Cellulomonas wangleii TaxID=2816956 RepID=A0ABX8D7N1_9CELL|nr:MULTISPECIES: pyridoxal 5'-phosphate synthase [Cellulomonas]MBO0900995.1 pyridoxal 5'-phosphate synthase [Cellulomonas sp. zg-ZUI22]MBO0921650.1 pyridoxal 5'-phosphate synthase [Cellulomonas wangleii]MBO0925143.1 pyridoxal 5'-phosphate synthase [Cellulomonas wangleii]QVI63450.1 pyridoxal 5'-phosphate synthase [Cellulomonas wangleii]
MRELLRSLPALSGTAPAFDAEAVPDDPLELFVDWFTTALSRGVPEPHAATLSTADVAGQPSARVLVLKDVGPEGFAFATDARSAKVEDLEVNPQAALTFWWQPVVRQVRISGAARFLGEEASAEDYLARSPRSRAAAASVRPGRELASVTDLRDAMARSRARIDEDPGFVLPTWQAWLVVPDVIEFWQGSLDRAHARVVYRSCEGGWSRGLVWP